MKKNKIKLWVKVIMMLILLIVALYFFINCIDNNSEETLFYEEKSNLNYKVCLNENEYYEDKCQPKGMSYIASAIEYVDIDFEYLFRMNKKVDYEYSYSIEGLIVVTESKNDKNILFSKKVDLLKSKKFENLSSEVFIITENLKIDYSTYTDLVKSFRDSYNISIDSNLIIVLHIETKSKYKNFDKDIVTANTIEITIPLTENTIRVNMNYKEINNSDNITRDSSELKINYLNLAIGLTVVAISFLILIFIISDLLKSNAKNEYAKFMKSIQKNYSRMIIDIDNNLKIEEKDYNEILDVRNFEELVDIAQNLGKSIVWTEVIHRGGPTVSWYTVAEDKRLYRKIYKSTDSKEDFK